MSKIKIYASIAFVISLISLILKQDFYVVIRIAKLLLIYALSVATIVGITYIFSKRRKDNDRLLN